MRAPRSADVDLPVIGDAVALADDLGGAWPTRVEDAAAGMLAVAVPHGPWSAAGEDAPRPGDRAELQWPHARGVATLGVELAKAAGSRWWLAPRGAVVVRQRRAFVRASTVMGLLRVVRRVPGAKPVTGQLADLSEGGARGLVGGWLAAQVGVGVDVRITTADDEFALGGTLLRAVRSELATEVVVAFDQPVADADRIRRCVFAFERRFRSAP